MTPIISIDPGQSGGIAYRNSDGIITAFSMPDTEGDVLDHLRMLVASGPQPIAVIERVGGFIGKAQPGSAMFKFGMGYGFIQGVLMTLGVSYELVAPQTWQKLLRLGAKGNRTTTEWKNILKAEAQRRFPQVERITKDTSDALLILAWKIG